MDKDMKLERHPDAIDLVNLGIDNLVYVRPVMSDDVKAFDAEAFGDLPDGLQLYSVHRANGVPVALLDDRDTAFAAATQYEMTPVSVH